MPSLSHRTPKYRKHKASSQAFVELNGHCSTGTGTTWGPPGTKTVRRAAALISLAPRSQLLDPAPCWLPLSAAYCALAASAFWASGSSGTRGPGAHRLSAKSS